jgi:hypothetical protein
MLSKCANPSCATPFLYLRHGRLFQAEVFSGNVRPVLALSSQLDLEIEAEDAGRVAHLRPAAKKELFWLCGECCLTRTIIFSRNGGLALVPLRSGAARRAAA